ncbi:DNA (cytosine-5-)-methyltransferase [Microbulbifer sp. Q7]|uniref:DNA (cytosine-5-)-methyltransferase n=1 Tax=Microbulbifer sp. Q7 TaxID=1785091 RepID=UPI0009EE6245|nr:DNA (cytosine-5-)-methyltransferase [Microbulbifer sp. Q7]
MNIRRSKKVTIIDLFAGPGGLGEGFSNCKNSPFEIAMSVEKEENAHKTLTLRSFYRKLKDKSLYIEYVTAKSKFSKNKVMKKIEQTEEWGKALRETMGSPHALGNSTIFEKWKNGENPTDQDFKERTKEQREIDKRIKEVCESTRRTSKKTPLKDCEPLIVIGGPPCQAYSTIGRGRLAGIADHNQDHDQRFFLYKEYADVIEKARPDLFVMENVSGIGSAKLANGSRIFPEIIKRLEYLKENPTPKDKKKYHIYSLVVSKENFIGTEDKPTDKDYLVNAVDFGVPQARKRVILLGINAEHDTENSLSMIMDPNEAPLAPSISETIGSLPPIRSSISKREASIRLGGQHLDATEDTDSNWNEIRKSNVEFIRKLVSGDSAIKRGVRDIIDWERTSARIEKAKNLKLPKDASEKFIKNIPLTPEEDSKILRKKSEYISLISETYKRIEEKLKTIDIFRKTHKGSDFYLNSKNEKAIKSKDAKRYFELDNWLTKDFPGTFNHCAKQHMPKDMTRYMFSALWTDARKKSPVPNREPSPSPTTKFFPKELASKHKSWYSKNFQDRFRTYPSTYRAKTITSHMHKDGHANIHYDPSQMRSLTVREAARIQTFPDDYYFEGGQSAQYLQVGNAVPPFLAKQIAEHVLRIMKMKEII